MPATKRLRAAFLNAVKDSGKSQATLAIEAGFKTRSQLAEVLCARRARHTDLMVSRLQLLAENIGFSEPVFHD